MNETKVRILDAAERLIAEHGLDVSLRAITAQAEVNLAAVNYHFQSKEALIDAVLERRIAPINERRMEMMDTLERQYPDGPLPLEKILEAFLAPVISLGHGEHVGMLVARFYASPDQLMSHVFQRYFQPIKERFSAAFAIALPEIPQADLLSCMMFSIGAVIHLILWSKLIGAISNGIIDPNHAEALVDRVVAFAAAGFRDAAARARNENQGARHA